MLSLSRFLPDLNSLLITIGPVFWGWHIRVKALPIVKSLLGAVARPTIRYRSRLKNRSVGKQVARASLLSDI
jgi:hypothetical protein